MNINKNKIFTNSLFWIILFAICIFLGFQNFIFLEPYGLHFIRQVDSLSFASNYYNFNNEFFSPEVYSLNSEGGKAACEFPIIYYIVSIFYYFFGEKEIFLRLINFSILAYGLYSLFRMFLLILKDKIIAYSLVFLVFSSGVLLYYSISFIPDTPSLGFVFIAWYFFVKYYYSGIRNELIISFFLFLIAGLLKVTYLISPITIVVLFVLENLKIQIDDKKIFNHKKLFYILSIGLFGLIGWWNYYAISYNKLYGDDYFLTAARPIWKMNVEEINHVWDLISNMWFPSYYYQTTIHVFIILTVVGLFLFNKKNRFFYCITLIMLAGTFMYVMLFFKQFADHDYYFMVLIPMIVFILINSINNINYYLAKYKSNLILRYAIMLLAILSLVHGNNKLTGRAKSNFTSRTTWISNEFKGIDAYLKTKNIPTDAVFQVIGDHTPNGSLYFLKRKGKTSMEFSKEFEYDYLVIQKSEIEKISNIKLKNIGSFNDLLIYSP